jgi:signal transduction histidine kinase
MRKETVLLIISLVAVMTLGSLNLFQKMKWQDVTDGVVWKETPNGLTAVQVDRESEAYLRAGIRKGDILSAINKTPVRTRIDVLKSLWTAAGTDQKVIYEINREGFQSYPSFYPRKKGVNPVYYYLFFVGVSTLALVVFVFINSKGKTTLPYRFFYVLSISFAAFSIFSPAGRLDTLDMSFYALDKLAFILFPPYLLNFFLIFPRRKDFLRRNPGLLTLLYAPAVVLILARLRLHLPYPSALGEAAALSLGELLERLELLHFLVLGLATLAVLADSTLRAPSTLLRKQVRLIFFGLTFGFLPWALAYGLPYLAGRIPSRGMELTVLLQALMPLTFFYSVSRSRVIDVEVLLKKAATLIFSFFVIAVLYLFVSSRTQLFSENKLNTIALGILAIILSTTLFPPLKRLFQALLDRAVYRRSYEYRRTLLAISRDLSRERNLAKLAASLLESVSNALSLRSSALLLADETDPASFSVLKARGAARSLPAAFGLDQKLITEMKLKDYIQLHALSEDRPIRAAAEPFLDHGFFHCLPLKIEDKLVGCLLMGKKQDGTFLSREDWELVTAVSGSTALALENAYLYGRESVRAMEMQRLKDYSENIIESLTVGVAVIDENHSVIGWNRVLEEQLGVRKEAALGRPLSSVLGEKNYASVFPAGTEPGYSLLSEVMLETGAGAKKIFDIARTPLLDNLLVSYGTIIVFEDVTEKVSLQHQLVTSEKLASIGLLSAGVAHEINTPLTGISSYIQMLQKRLTDVHYAEILKKIEAQTDRMAKIIKNLLAFARNPADMSFHRVNLKELVEGIVALIDYKLKSMNISLKLDLGETGPVYAQPERLQQVLINIIINALDAMPRGGDLGIGLAQDGDRAVIRVSDTGVGIKPEHLPRIFDPFFTTKGVGKGTGLGLSISYAIIREHSGDIRVESEVGRGTTFTISLPAGETPPAKHSVLRT